jgi:hypothetical protein
MPNSGEVFSGGIETMAPQEILLFISSNIFIDLIVYNLYNINVKKILPPPGKELKPPLT